MFFKKRPYSLSKSRQILQTTYQLYQKKGASLSLEQKRILETDLQALQTALLAQDQEEANRLAKQVQTFSQTYFKKNLWDYTAEMAVAVVVALVVATLVRQMWFEPYEIPTGSMRPTFKEQDDLTVTKTAFGINVPLMTKHFYFDPKLVQRTGVVVWSGDNVPHLDSHSTFMGIFPYTKRFIKRCMGKPGDILYFYGGKIYGMDHEGNDLVELRDNPWTTRLEHIPFTEFGGRRSYVQDPLSKVVTQSVFHFFNQAIGRIRFLGRSLKGEIFNGQEWIEDKPEAQRDAHQTLQTYSDFWGIRNFAMGRLLTKEQMEKYTSFRAKDMEEGLLYLELRHTPSMSYPLPLLSERFGGVFLKGYSTVLPLQEKHLNNLMQNLYTCRFIVKEGKAAAYRLEKAANPQINFAQVPNGTYEFYYGKGVSVGWGAITSALATDHPLYSHTPANIQRLYNTGIDMTSWVEPQSRDQVLFPNRYVYFREGALYAMGGTLIEKEDPLLKSFEQREKQREKLATAQAPYVAFQDYGPPLNAEGQLDKDFLRTFGLKIPEGHYLMLGDNHAMSQDSRYFGPIPQSNLQGVPSLILWPPGERWGVPNQKPYPLFTIPRLIVWSLVATIGLIWYLWHLRRLKRPLLEFSKHSGNI